MGSRHVYLGLKQNKLEAQSLEITAVEEAQKRGMSLGCGGGAWAEEVGGPLPSDCGGMEVVVDTSSWPRGQHIPRHPPRTCISARTVPLPRPAGWTSLLHGHQGHQSSTCRTEWSPPSSMCSGSLLRRPPKHPPHRFPCGRPLTELGHNPARALIPFRHAR